jgi:hypothetical protein
MDGSEAADSLLGIGLYTVPEAAHLTVIPQARLRRWLQGYTYRRGDQPSASEPTWQRQLPEIDGTLGLGFLDLRKRGSSTHSARPPSHGASSGLARSVPGSFTGLTIRFRLSGSAPTAARSSPKSSTGRGNHSFSTW